MWVVGKVEGGAYAAMLVLQKQNLTLPPAFFSSAAHVLKI
mgnify:CR=1 FL=1